MRKLVFTLLFSLVSLTITYGQGILRGKIVDENGETIVGAIIKLDPLTAVFTDFDGNFSLPIKDSKTHIIQISSIGYENLNDTIQLSHNEVVIKDHMLQVAVTKIEGVEIVAKAKKSNNTYMQVIKMQSLVSMNYISADVIKKTGDVNVISAISRVSGVSTNGGFLTVRGIGDRYIKTTINGARIPTLDPLTNSIKLDLFPASLVDNIVIKKTASPDLPGDWAGAYISVETKDYPDKLMLNFESSVGYNNQSTFNEVLSSEKSSTNWLGYDNRYKNVDLKKNDMFFNPNAAVNNNYQLFVECGMTDYFKSMGITENTVWNDTYVKLSLVQLGYLGAAQLNDANAYKAALDKFNNSSLKHNAILNVAKANVDLAKKLPNTWAAKKAIAPLDFSQSFSIGNQIRLFHRPLGFIMGFRYSSSITYDGDAFYGSSRQVDQIVTESTASAGITGDEDPLNLYDFKTRMKTSRETNGLSALANVAYKFSKNHSLSLLYMSNIIGVNKVFYDSGMYDGSGSPIIQVRQRQFYESRRQTIYQAKLENYIPGPKIRIETNVSYTKGESDIPDNRLLLYNVNDDFFTPSIDGTCYRLFRFLKEDLLDSRIDAEMPIWSSPKLPRKFKIGGMYQNAVRNSNQYMYYLGGASGKIITNNDFEDFFRIENFNISDAYSFPLWYYPSIDEQNQTIGFNKIYAAYAMVDYAVIGSLRFSGGIRAEKSHIHTDLTNYYDLQIPANDERRIYRNPSIKDTTYFLPSLNLLYTIKQDKSTKINARLNFSKTVARPSLRELTAFWSYDYELMGEVTGNPKLKDVNIYNYDFRLESYFKDDQNISVSVFYKSFANHIYLTKDVTDLTRYTWQNLDKSDVKGIEFEGKKNLTKTLDFSSNITLVKSKTWIKGKTKDGKSDSTIIQSMFGQAPYVINAMLTYESSKSGISAAISYNVQGARLVLASGVKNVPDIFEMPRQLVDFKISKKIGKSFSTSFKIRDLFNTSITRAYKYTSGWLTYDSYQFGTSYIFSISYNLNTSKEKNSN